MRYDGLSPMSSSALQRQTSLEWAHPLVREWFLSRFGSPTEPQIAGWPEILANRDTLISAPTGSGKTLAAFLACIDRLVRQAVLGTLGDRTSVVYVSPLKALGNDIQKNLDGPLAEIVALGRLHGYDLHDIRTAVRTGDTLMPDRRAMMRRAAAHSGDDAGVAVHPADVRHPAARCSASVETVIVDEIHAVADDKRGAHLALSLERLDALAGRTAAAHRPVGDRHSHRRRSRSSWWAPAGRRRTSCRSRAGASSTWRSRSRAASSAPWPRTSSGMRSTTGSPHLVTPAPLDAGVRQHAPRRRARCASSGGPARRRQPSPRITGACRARRASTPSSA